MIDRLLLTHPSTVELVPPATSTFSFLSTHTYHKLTQHPYVFSAQRDVYLRCNN
jgi:hypothetical protein